MPTSPCSLVRATSSRHHSSRQPRVMHVVLDTSSIVPRPRTYVFLGHLAVYGYIHSFPVCFAFLSLSRLVATFLSFPPLLLLPSDSDSRRSFRPRARCRASTYRSFSVSYLITGLSSHTTPRALPPSGHSFDFDLFPPSLSLCVAYMYRYGLGLNIYTKPCFAEKQATAAHPFPISFACVCFGATVAHSRLVFLFLYVLSSLSPFVSTPAIDIRHYQPRTRAFRHIRRQLTLAFRPSRRRTLTAVGITTHAHRPQSLSRAFSLRERRPGFIISCAPLNSRADLHSALQHFQQVYETMKMVNR
jgi:hypothetical protein